MEAECGSRLDHVSRHRWPPNLHFLGRCEPLIFPTPVYSEETIEGAPAPCKMDQHPILSVLFIGFDPSTIFSWCRNNCPRGHLLVGELTES